MGVAVSHSLTECLGATVSRYPDRPALTIDDRTFTYAQLAGAVGALAAALAEGGVGPDQRVAILFPNSPQFVISYFAVLQTGATVVPLHCLQGPEELAHAVNDSGAETLVALNALAPVVEAVRLRAPGLKRVIISGESKLEGVESWESLLRPRMGPAPVVPRTEDDLAVLIYTSGTTGRPKGAMLSHGNLLANARSCKQVLEINHNDVFCGVLPLFHAFGATICMILPVMCGAQSVLVPKFSPLTVLETVVAYKATVLAGVPSMFAVMAQVRTERNFDLSGLRACASGGAALPNEVLYAFDERYGTHIVEGYGPTEASPVVSVNPPRGLRKVGTVGPALPQVSIRICDEDMNWVPAGTEGEICVQGPNVMQGYWHNPTATAETIRNGWLLTGDIGMLDEDGYLSICDRKKDMIIVGGMNVYPREVEDVLFRLPAVAEAAVIGVPSRLRGEDVKAFISLREGASLEAQTVIDFCKNHLANYKVPRTVEFREALPLSGTGKVLKRLLREEHQACR
ncbi:long-chain fatty acid--CoA ligase [bacterium]|nr:long-chain fatty acid--CoA ligase [bacterium]